MDYRYGAHAFLVDKPSDMTRRMFQLLPTLELPQTALCLLCTRVGSPVKNTGIAVVTVKVQVLIPTVAQISGTNLNYLQPLYVKQYEVKTATWSYLVCGSS